jgi:hypothetical protein
MEKKQRLFNKKKNLPNLLILISLVNWNSQNSPS